MFLILWPKNKILIILINWLDKYILNVSQKLKYEHGEINI